MNLKFLPLAWLILVGLTHAQVAINTDGAPPHPLAMLDITSTDKGLLIPRMTQAQMEALGAPGESPATGLLVYNTSVNAFFFYNTTTWQELRTAVADGDTSPTNEIQTLSRAGTNITLSQGGGTVSIADLDNDPTNELQDLGISSNGTDRSVTITGGTGVNFSIADNDNDASNELQTLGSSASGENRTVSISGGNSVTFSVADSDNDPTNELDSKWNSNGNDIHNKNSGNVGIGLSAPQQKLDVNGRVRIRGDSPEAGLVLTAINSNGDGRWHKLHLHDATVTVTSEQNSLGDSGWLVLPNFSVDLDGLSSGDQVLVLVDFRCSLNGLGSGSDDFAFRIAGGGATSNSTGWIETLDQHRDHWNHVSFQRTLTVTQSGTASFNLQVNHDDADDRIFFNDLTMTVIAL